MEKKEDLEAIKDILTDLKARFHGFEKKIDSLFDATNAVRSDVSSLETEVQNLDTSVSMVESTVTNIELFMARR